MNRQYKIAIIIILILIIVHKLDRMWNDHNKLLIRNSINTKLTTKIKKGNYKVSSPEHGISSSISFWMYIEDWDYRYMHDKPIFDFGEFKCYLASKSNDMLIELPVYNKKAPEVIRYSNLPLQRWLHIVVILENRHLDLWVNGKLHRYKHLENIPKINNDNDLIIGAENGYDGSLKLLNVWDHSINKRHIQYLFNKGPVEYTLYENTVGRILYAMRYIMQKFKINISVDVET